MVLPDSFVLSRVVFKLVCLSTLGEWLVIFFDCFGFVRFRMHSFLALSVDAMLVVL